MSDSDTQCSAKITSTRAKNETKIACCTFDYDLHTSFLLSDSRRRRIRCK